MNVTERSDSDVIWRTSSVQVRACGVSSMDNNIYVASCTATGAQVLIDAADDASRIAALVPGGLDTLDAVITTHRHWDHHRALVDVVEASSATTYAGAADAEHLPAPTDVALHHQDVVRVGNLELTVVALRGHTPGSITLALAGGDAEATTLLFTGDSLFPGGPGKTESAQDFTTLMDDLEDRVFAVFGDGSWVLPGHGARTTLGDERPALGQWRQRGW
ncbi:MAG: MBL fold metallo-hydrolase [Ornithinimicrobium sp.]